MVAWHGSYDLSLGIGWQKAHCNVLVLERRPGSVIQHLRRGCGAWHGSVGLISAPSMMGQQMRLLPQPPRQQLCQSPVPKGSAVECCLSEALECTLPHIKMTGESGVGCADVVESHCILIQVVPADLNVHEFAIPCHALAQRMLSQLYLELIQIHLICKNV